MENGSAAPGPLEVEAGLLVDGRGGLHRDVRLLVAGGRVTAIRSREEPAGTATGTRLGSRDAVVLPGLVNAHQHGRSGPTTALGVPDAPLELWLVGLLGLPPTELHAETVAAARRLAAGGATTALHCHYTTAGTAADYERELLTIADGYNAVGIRVVIAADVRDRGEPVYGDTRAFLAGLPGPLRSWVEARLSRPLPVGAALEAVTGLRKAARGGELGLADVILGPPGPPWCSDVVWRRVAAVSDREGIPVQTHVLETRDERVQALLEYGCSAVEHLERHGVLSPWLSIAHAVWLDERDIGLLRRREVTVVTNPASNLRLHSGVAPVRRYLDDGVNVAIGTDNNSLADDESMLGELRLAAALHRRPLLDDGGVPVGDLLAMATTNAGRWLRRPHLGAVEVGAPADLVILGQGAARPFVALPAIAPAAVVCDGRVVPTAGPRGTAGGPMPAEHEELLAALRPHVTSHYQAAARRAALRFPHDTAIDVSH